MHQEQPQRLPGFEKWKMHLGFRPWEVCRWLESNETSMYFKY